MMGNGAMSWFGADQVGSLVLPKQRCPPHNHRDIFRTQGVRKKRLSFGRS